MKEKIIERAALHNIVCNGEQHFIVKPGGIPPGSKRTRIYLEECPVKGQHKGV